MILLLFLSFHWILLVAVNEVTQFGFLTHPLSSSKSNDNFTVTLWFNHTIYQNEFYPRDRDTWYHAYKETPNPRFTVLGSSHCNPETKIMFEQMSGDDSVKFTTIQFDTYSGDFYAIRADGVTEEYMCVDSVGTGCVPPKQMFYFDISRPNTYIEDAVHMDATSVTPQIETCDPTGSPSNHPTKSPSNEPSVNPSRATANPSDVTAHPSIAPSDVTANPSVTPSGVTAHPSIAPSRVTANPSIAPSDVTANPSITPSSVRAHPTESPTRDPEHNVQFTIEIKLNSCTNDGSEPCAFDETEDEINAILIAYLDETVTIVGTVIERGTIKVVLSHGYEQLDRDQITDGIKNELERKYGQDVEVTITKNEDVDGEQDEDEDASDPFKDFIDSYGMTYVVVMAIVISICLIISLLLCFYFKRKTAKVREERMLSRQITGITEIGGDTVTDQNTSTGGNVPGCKDNDEEDDGGEGSQMREDESHDSDDLYDTPSVVVTNSTTTKGSTTEGATTKGATTSGKD